MSNACCDVHGVDEANSFLHATFANELFDGVGDIDVIAPVRCLKPKMLGQTFHPPFRTSDLSRHQVTYLPGAITHLAGGE